MNTVVTAKSALEALRAYRSALIDARRLGGIAALWLEGDGEEDHAQLMQLEVGLLDLKIHNQSELIAKLGGQS